MKPTPYTKIEEFIRRVRNLAPHTLRQSCTRGNCYNFYRLLKLVFPDVQPYEVIGEDHVVTRLRDRYYDIYGRYQESTKVRPLRGESAWQSCHWDEVYFLVDVANKKVSNL